MSNEKTVGLIDGKKVQLKCQIPTTGFTLGTFININIIIYKFNQIQISNIIIFI